MNKLLLSFIFLISSLLIKAQTLYWVGGSGNWNDASHWSSVSGGNGGVKVPGLYDNVVFDKKSFPVSGISSVNLGAFNYCRSISVSSATSPFSVFGSSSSRIKIQGDFSLNDNCNWQSEGTIEFTSDRKTKIIVPSNEVKGNMSFNSASGDFELSGNLNLSGTLYLENGKLSSTNSTLNIRSLLKQSSGSFDLRLDNVIINVTGKVKANSSMHTTSTASGLFYYPSENAGGIDSTGLLGLRFQSQFSPASASISVVIGDSVSCPGLCNGSLVVTFTATGVQAAAPYTITATNGVDPITVVNGIPSPGTYTITNLCGGCYAVRVYNNNSAVLPITQYSGPNSCVYSPPPIIVDFYEADSPLCNGDTTGKIVYDIGGGNLEYTAVWQPNNETHSGLVVGQLDSIINLGAATYTINVTDRKGCTYLDSLPITEPTLINPHASALNQTCFGVCDSYGLVAPTGGTPFSGPQSSGIPYTVEWQANPAFNNDTLYNLCPGTYNFVVTDSNNCTMPGSVTINPITQLTFTPGTPTSQSCYDICDGTASVLGLNGGQSPYSFSWSGPTVPTVIDNATSSFASDLCAGSYTCTITDANGCDTTVSFTITAPGTVVGSVVTTDVKCFGNSDGTASGSVVGGTPNFTYAWYFSGGALVPGGNNVNPYSSFAAGNYDMVVTDANGCDDTVSFTINEPAQLDVTLTATNPSCFGFSDGQICANISGGTMAYITVWSPNSGTVAANCYTNLSAGSYSVMVTDAHGCKDSANVTLTSPTKVLANLIYTNPSCNASCDGTATVSPTGGSNSGFSYSWSCSTDTDSIINGQCAGSCTVIVTDSLGCTATDSVTFNDPNPLTVTLSSTGLNCYGATTAQISSVVNGGTAPYFYSWDTGPVTPGLVNVGAGTYTLTVTDSKGCSKTASITINSPTQIVITDNPTNPTCNGSCNGSITSSAVGGTLPYTHSWNTGSTNFNINNLCAGSYTLTVTDSKGCVQKDTVVLTQPTVIIVSTDTTAASCLGTCNGTATANASGGNAGGYTYSWSGGGGNSNPATGLCAGNYNVTVTDPMGCTGSATAIVTEPTAVTAIVSNITPSCSNLPSGGATASASGGTPGYTFTVDGNPTGANMSGLGVGSHTLVATDANGCSVSTVFNVPPQVTMVITSSSTVLTCSGSCDGTATANVAGGVGSLVYQWTCAAPSPTPQNTQTATGLCAGTHTVQVTDSNGCVIIDSVTFVNPAVFSASTSSLPISCDGSCTGSATINPSGGVAPYTISWSTGAVGATITNQCIGTYTATVLDSNGCSLTQTVDIVQPTAFVISPVATNPSTCGGADGSIQLNVSGGSGFYTYAWTTGPTTNPLTNLTSGLYSVTITDTVTGCDTTMSFSLSDPGGPATTQVSSNVLCHGFCTGSATVNVTTSTGPATVTWPGGVPAPQAPPLTVNNLCAGVYNVLITDASGCNTFEVITITEPNQFVLGQNVTNLTCNGDNSGSIVCASSGGTPGYTYTIDGTPDDFSMTGLSAMTHSIHVIDANGCNYDFNSIIVSEPAVLSDNMSHVNLNCSTGFGSATISVSGGTSPYSYSWSAPSSANTATAVNLVAGTYTCTVTDNHGCQLQDTVNITSNPAIVTGLTFTNNLCSGGCTGTALFNASGGSGGYTYSWSVAGTGSSVNGLCPGNYTGTVSDNNGCSVTDTFVIVAPPVLMVSTSATNALCNGTNTGSLSSNPSGGTPGYTFSWSGTPSLSSGSQNPVNVGAGTYTVTVTDANGCTATSSKTITQPPILLANVTTTMPVCYGDCNGLAVSVPSGGTAGYNYSWGPAPNTGSNDTLTGLCIGSYSLVVTDAHGCKDTATVNMTQPPHVGLSASVSAANCGVVPCDGAININNIVGTTITWLTAPYAGSNTLSETDVCAGIYDIKVNDANGCTDTVAVSVSSSNGPIVNVDSTNVNCLGLCDGTATVVSISGTGPYTYSWSPPITDTDSIASNLCAGTYQSTVTDSQNCLTITDITINEPQPLDDHETISVATCFGVSDGSISLAPTGGTPPYSYVWGGGQLTSGINNIGPGTYSVTITDANNCTYTFSYNVGSNTLITAQAVVTNPTCFAQCIGVVTLTNIAGGTAPYTYSWNDGQTGITANGLCAGNYTCTIADANNCKVSIDTTITEPVQLIATPTVTNTACGSCAGSISLSVSGGSGSSYTYQWGNGQTTSTASSLCAGIYSVDITDSLGCVSQVSFAVDNTNGPTVSISATDVTCSGICDGTAVVTASGGTAPYQYNWLSVGQTTDSVSNLCAGTYFVQVKDALNCLVNNTVVINNGTTINANPSVVSTPCGACVGSVTLTPSGGSGSYTYSWSNGLPASNTENNLCAGSYTVIVTDTPSGCRDTALVSISSSNAPLVSISTDSVSCNGGSNGQATATISGGAAPYTVLWSNSTNNISVTNLAAGQYAVTVTDANGCVSVRNFSIEEANALGLSLNNTQLPTCSSVCNGALTAIPSGGTLPYTYLWNPGNATADTINNLCAGIYSINVADANGCTVSQVTQLNDNINPFTINPNTVDPSCGQCNGSSTLTVSGGNAPYTFNWSNGSVDSTAAALCAGVYMIDITDSLGCSQQYSLAISNSSAPGVSVVTTDVTCANQANGSAIATASGGTSPYQYNWISGGQATSSVTGLSAGIYFVQVKDADNCTVTQEVDIFNQTLITPNIQTTQATCGACDGTATLSPFGGSGGGYTYSWLPGPLPATASQSNLCAGIYTVTITDAGSGCDTTILVTISSSNAPSVTLTVDSVSCNGGSDGQALATISGGTGPYTIAWSNNTSNNPLTGLNAGVYAVSVTDVLGCTSSQSFNVDEANVLSLSLSNTQLPTCSAICNGAITAVPNGGVLPYSYSWAPGGQTTNMLQNLCAGTYVVTATDAHGCSISQATLLQPGLVPFVVTDSITKPGCAMCDGVIDITVSSGLSPYTYSWSNGASSEDVSSVCAGVYDVNITDSAGCTQTISFAVSSANGITGDTITKTDVSCFASCDGSATVGPVGGSPGYSYLWLFNGATSSTQNNLCIGTYFVEIADTNGCVWTSEVDINSPAQMFATTFVTAPTCGNNDGSISITVTGGTAPLSYSWSGGVAGNTPVATNLAAGSYTVSVTDGAVNPCVQTFTVDLSNSNGPAVMDSVNSVSCSGLCDGSIYLNVTSGNPITVQWNNGSTANPLTGLCPANYSAVVTDNVTLCSTVISSEVVEPDSLIYGLSNTIDPTCFGLCDGAVVVVPSGGTLPFTFSWSPVSGSTPSQVSLCSGTYDVTVTDANGCSSVQSVTLNDPPDIVVTGVVTNTNCSSFPAGAIDITVTGGVPNSSAPYYTFQWSGGSSATSEDISSLVSNGYTVVVTDANSCTDTSNYNVAAADTVIANAGPDQAICSLDSVTLSAVGSFISSGTITYQWNDMSAAITLGTTDSIKILPDTGSFNYQLIVTNSIGCSDTDTVVVVANPLPVADAGSDVEMLLGQTSVIGGNPTGSVGTTLVWLPAAGLTSNTVANPTSSAVVTTNYTVTVTDTITGCIAVDSMTLTILPQIFIPNGISPNGDGKNDLWVINAIYRFPDNDVEVYNRWGELLYSKHGYDNTWDGTYKGKPLPIGTYYYVVNLNDPSYPDAYTGPLTIFK